MEHNDDDDDTTKPLTDRMRSATRNVHDISNQRVVGLLLGFVLTSKTLYGEALSLFAPIYAKIENLLMELCEENNNDNNNPHPQLSKFRPFLSILRRSDKFENDLDFYLSPAQRQDINERRKRHEPKELHEYLLHLDTLAKDDPLLLIPYSYHMYMAIFAGGSIIARMLRTAFALKKDKDDGVHAFSFPNKEDHNHFDKEKIRNQFKACINIDMNLTEEQKQRILQESVQLFERNNALIATIKNTSTFEKAAWRCGTGIILLALAFLVIVVAVMMAKHPSPTTSQ